MGMAKMWGPPKTNKKKSNNTAEKGQRITTLNWQAKKRKCPVNVKFVDYPLKQCRGIIHSSVWQTFSTWRGEWVILCPSGVECKLVSFFLKGSIDRIYPNAESTCPLTHRPYSVYYSGKRQLYKDFQCSIVCI